MEDGDAHDVRVLPSQIEKNHWPHFIPGTKSAGLQVGLAGLAPAEPKHPVGGASCNAWTRSESSAQTHVVQWFTHHFTTSVGHFSVPMCFSSIFFDQLAHPCFAKLAYSFTRVSDVQQLGCTSQICGLLPVSCPFDLHQAQISTVGTNEVRSIQHLGPGHLKASCQESPAAHPRPRYSNAKNKQRKVYIGWQLGGVGIGPSTSCPFGVPVVEGM